MILSVGLRWLFERRLPDPVNHLTVLWGELVLDLLAKLLLILLALGDLEELVCLEKFAQ